jgi:2-polyprenyl-3-methyl-5-hydroxy-6-metoxy-1,4-benzoquinol methylase
MVHILPSENELEALRVQKYGPVDAMGWLVRRRRRFRYYLPADVYETLVSKLIVDGVRWLDVGGGRSIFPENPTLARTLAGRCTTVVAVDPSDNVRKNTSAHEAVQSTLEAYQPNEAFDVATARMVVEHVSDPESFVAALARLVRPGGAVVILTVGLWSPVTIVSRLLPFRFHHTIKRMVWGGAEEDTFPAFYRMNTRRSLRRLFDRAGFSEELFTRVDDLSVFGDFRRLGYVELLLWRSLSAVGLPYPEGCLVAVYRKGQDRN